MAKNKTVAITGANGFLGSALVEHFVQAGYTVRALVRKPSEQPVREHVSYVAYDLATRPSDDLLQGCDYLVHAAFVKQTAGIDAMKINVDGAEWLKVVAGKAGVKRTVFVSSMSAHDTATSTYGLQKLAIEKIFNGPNEVSIRSGLIIGNGGLVKQMADFMRSKHAVPLIGGGHQPLQTIAVYDLARAIEAALASTVSGILTIATPEIYEYKAFYAALGQRLDVRFTYIPVPYIAIQTIIRIIEKLRLPLGVNEDNLIGLKNLRAAETAADLARLNLTIDPLQQALKKTPQI